MTAVFLSKCLKIQKMKRIETRGSTSAQSAVLTAKVFNDFDGFKHSIQYNTVDELMNSVYDLLHQKYEGNYSSQDNVRVSLPDGKEFNWLSVFSHYCFAKGRISEGQAFELMIEAEGGRS